MAYRDRKPSAETLLLDTAEWSERLARHVEDATAEGFLRDEGSKARFAVASRSSARRPVA